MSYLADPVGFLADLIACAKVLQCEAPAESTLRQKHCQTREEEHQLERYVEESNKDIEGLTAIEQEHDSLSPVETDIPSEKLHLLVKLLGFIEARTRKSKNKVVFGVFVKYKHFGTDAVLGFGGDSSEQTEEIIKKIDRFYRSTQAVSAPKSSYIALQIRGKYDVGIETFCSAVLLNILTMVCSLSTDVKLASADECSVEALGEDKMIVILKPKTEKYNRHDWDEKRRVFLLGKTRSGKSTLGNALAGRNIFHESKGVTGTVRVERCDIVHVEGSTQWVTEICDTPGLYDKDELDILYKADIEDHVRALQRASTFMMTINVDGGLDAAVWKSLQTYKDLFGNSMVSLLVLVLTVNHTANTEVLQGIVELNWPSITGASRAFAKKNVFAISLHDLRTLEDSRSHEVARNLANLCRRMPMRPLAAFIDHINSIRNAVNSRAGNVSDYYQELLNTGWKGYEELTNQYASSYRVCMKDTQSGPLFNGFVMNGKLSSPENNGASFFGRMMRKTGRTVVYTKPTCQEARDLWLEFVAEHKHEKHSAHLMWEFGETLYKKGFGVMVQRGRKMSVPGLRMDSHSVFVIQPNNSAQQTVSTTLYSLTNECPEELNADVIHDIANEALPIALRFQNRVVKNRLYQFRKKNSS